MTNHRLNRVVSLTVLTACAFILAGCGGSESLAPDTTATTTREQMTLNRAMQANSDALSQIKGERATRQTSQ